MGRCGRGSREVLAEAVGEHVVVLDGTVLLMQAVVRAGRRGRLGQRGEGVELVRAGQRMWRQLVRGQRVGVVRSQAQVGRRLQVERRCDEGTGRVWR